MAIEKQSTDVSSVGPKWPPQRSSFNRVKGIYDLAIVSESNALKDVLETIDASIQDMVVEDDKGAAMDRLSVRVLLTSDCLVGNTGSLASLGEAVVPLSGSPEFEDVNILYLGHNLPTRLSNIDDLRRAVLNVEKAATRGKSKCSTITERAKEQGFRLEVLDSMSKTDDVTQDQMANLYKRFGWNSSEVRQILSSEGNIIAVAKCAGKIVSAGIAETVMVTFETGEVLRIAEITEAATDEEFQGRGLYSAVAATLVKELNRLSRDNALLGGQIDLVFGECNGNEPGVLKAVKSLGRTFAYEISKEMGLPFKGYLQQHVPIAGAPRATPYNDLFPAFITRTNIEEFVKS